jgi:hypothetical protein
VVFLFTFVPIKLNILNNIVMAKSTKVRVLENGNGDYNHLEIQIIEESYNSGFMGTINVIGSITFQQTKGENEWYGMRYVISTDRFADLSAFQKVAKLINTEAEWRSQPEDILSIINAEKYYIFKQEFFKEEDKGKYCFNVMQNNQIYSRVVAKDRISANKIVKRFMEKNDRISKDFGLTTDTCFQIN